MRGADILVHSLKKADVDTIFSLSGNQVMPIYDACLDAGIRIVHTRHEGAAIYMADAWAQITGRLGVALVAAGPGFTNSMSALFSARHAESPVLLLSGDSPLSQDGMGAFQEMDQAAVTRPLVKSSLRATRLDTLGLDLMDMALLALGGRPGPVHLALPFDLLEARTTQAQLPDELLRADTKPPADLNILIDRIDRAKRPIILTGPHCNHTRAPAAALKTIRERLHIPVIPMESPRGLKDPSLGSFADVLKQADLIVLLGKKPDFSLQFGQTPDIPESATIAIIDPETEMLERAARQFGERLYYSARADALPTFDALARLSASARDKTWLEQVDRAIANRKLANAATPGKGMMSPQMVCARVQPLLAGSHEAILICDGGEFGQWGQALCKAPTRVINGLSGAIGGGLPYAIAAKIARPQAQVTLFMGDGTAGFHLAEFDTAARENLPITVIIGNDCKWNAEHLIQLRDYGPKRQIGCELSAAARYEQAAQALGALGFAVSSTDELDEALGQAASSTKPVCINAMIDGAAAPEYTAMPESELSTTQTA